MASFYSSWSTGPFASLGPLLSLLVPFIRSISRRYRIQTNSYYCELLSRRHEAETLLLAPETERYPGLRTRLNSLLRDIDRELASLEWDDEAFRVFILIAAIELVSFSGVVFAGVWNLRTIIVSRSWRSGIPFFEGIFQYVPTRVALFMVIVACAAWGIKQLAPRIESRIENYYLRVAAYFGVFHLLILAVGFVLFEALVLTDPISPYW